jgi:hypothetical protein
MEVQGFTHKKGREPIQVRIRHFDFFIAYIGLHHEVAHLVSFKVEIFSFYVFMLGYLVLDESRG